jgi:hypothetical protein
MYSFNYDNLYCILNNDFAEYVQYQQWKFIFAEG